MTPFNSPYLPIYLFILLFLSGCGQDDEQRKFEQQAFQSPSGITETDFSGNLINEDSDDWRVSPFYAGIFFVEPVPFPNPVSLSDKFNISVDNPYQEGISFLKIVVLIEDGSSFDFKTIYSSQQQEELEVIVLDPGQFGRFQNPESARGLHRVILLDGQDNVVSYGDVRVK